MAKDPASTTAYWLQSLTLGLGRKAHSFNDESIYPRGFADRSRRKSSDNTETIEEILRKLVAFPTVTDDHAANHAAFEYIATYLQQRGMHVQRFAATPERNEALVASTRTDNVKTPTVLLAAHLDVVAAEPEMFHLRREADRYIGRGVYDMKNAIAAYLYLVDDLRDELTAYDFTIMITSDEESAGVGQANGTRSLLAAGYLPRVVCLPDGGRDWQLETSAKGLLRYILEAHGKSAHGSRPWQGENALFKLTEVLHELKDQFKDHGPDTDTFNLGVLEGGEVFNKVPHYAWAEIDIRLNNESSRRRLKASIAGICAAHDITATLHLELAPIETDITHPLVRSFSAAVEAVVGIKMRGVKSYGGSDARFFAARGIPYMTFYPFGGGHHGSDEWLDVASLEYLPQILRRYLDEVARH